MKTSRPFLQVLMLLSLLFSVCFCGCTTSSQLPSGSVYGTDSVLFNYEKTVPGAFSALNVFVTWEYQHRQSLAQWPEIKKAADAIRVSAPEWRTSAINLRNAYVGNPTESNRSALQKEIDTINQALLEAQNYLSAHPTTS